MNSVFKQQGPMEAGFLFIPQSTDGGRHTGELYSICISLLLTDNQPISFYESLINILKHLSMFLEITEKNSSVKGMNGKLMAGHQKILLSCYCIPNRCG